MRLHEFISEEEWQRLEQLIYASTYKALAAYQQYRTTQSLTASKPAAGLQPQVAKKSKSLSRKAKRIPHAAPPRPLPKPNLLPQTKAEVTQAYRPVKTATPLPPTTRMAVARAKLPASKPAPNKPAPPSITDPNHIDQATRRMLPPNKRGPNLIALIKP